MQKVVLFSCIHLNNSVSRAISLYKNLREAFCNFQSLACNDRCWIHANKTSVIFIAYTLRTNYVK